MPTDLPPAPAVRTVPRMRPHLPSGHGCGAPLIQRAQRSNENISIGAVIVAEVDALGHSSRPTASLLEVEECGNKRSLGGLYPEVRVDIGGHRPDSLSTHSPYPCGTGVRSPRGVPGQGPTPPGVSHGGGYRGNTGDRYMRLAPCIGTHRAVAIDHPGQIGGAHRLDVLWDVGNMGSAAALIEHSQAVHEGFPSLPGIGPPPSPTFIPVPSSVGPPLRQDFGSLSLHHEAPGQVGQRCVERSTCHCPAPGGSPAAGRFVGAINAPSPSGAGEHERCRVDASGSEAGLASGAVANFGGIEAAIGIEKAGQVVKVSLGCHGREYHGRRFPICLFSRTGTVTL